MKKMIELDPLLLPYEQEITKRTAGFEQAKKELLGNQKNLAEFANGHLYFGFHKEKDGWLFREWAPGAEKMFLIGDFNGWNRCSHPMKENGNGVWEIFVQDQKLVHGTKVKVHIHCQGQCFDRIPAYIRRVEQNADCSFDGILWDPQPFVWQDENFTIDKEAPLLIYECHIGISGEEEKVHSFQHFTKYILPRIKKLGYTAIQLMGIMSHPYYGSFGYQVANFFAVSHWFGTPEDLKELVQTAHQMGIVVLLDLVHAHAASNVLEGLGDFDGTNAQYFYADERGNHPQWGSKVFNYGKKEVQHFLLSNIKFWLEEYHFDGFRFDGVTSMLYHSHGVGKSFDGYKDYFSSDMNKEGIAYLQLATQTAKEVKQDAVLIAEEVSGMPGVCLPVSWGGLGFDYRMQMGVPDYWVYLLEKVNDEHWDFGKLWHELTTGRPLEKTIAYAECHDQGMVGDKTIMQRLAGSKIYTHMSVKSEDDEINRAVAFHKMIRLITALSAGAGYLNFMGNEFGHPEWLDFPREGNGFSYQYARRQWHLADDANLRYQHLQQFDVDLMRLIKDGRTYHDKPRLVCHDQKRMLLIIQRKQMFMVFHFHPYLSHKVTVEVDCPTPLLEWLQTEDAKYGGDDSRKIILDQCRNQATFEMKARTAAIWKIV